jgi:hypothetical protein
MVSGRFPIDIWPRQLAWAIEWSDTTKDLTLRRGSPWFCLTFDSTNPEDSVSLVRAKLTPELEAYQNSIRNVVGYVSGTFGLFKDARARRPPQLLVPEE